MLKAAAFGTIALVLAGCERAIILDCRGVQIGSLGETQPDSDEVQLFPARSAFCDGNCVLGPLPFVRQEGDIITLTLRNTGRVSEHKMLNVKTGLYQAETTFNGAVVRHLLACGRKAPWGLPFATSFPRPSDSP